jgi:hypothetical protein
MLVGGSMSRLLAALLVAPFALVFCSCNESHNSSGSPSASASVTAASSAGTTANDGTDAKNPVLSPDDTHFVDSRKGYGWGERCFAELKQGKLGWARAACDRALALPEVDPKAKPALLFNEGLIAEKSGDLASAKSYFTQSLALRPPDDVGRATVEKELMSIGGSSSPPAPPLGTSPLGKDECIVRDGASIRVEYDLNTMMGELVLIDKNAGKRDLQVKATPHAATMILVFDGYAGAADHTPPGEVLAKGAIVAREVQVLDDTRLYFDGDFHPAISLPSQGFFTCQPH